jgi:prepilin-type N-terminal cleavage/methylation domain-containing protein
MNQHGMTLIEVCVAMMLMGTGLVFVAAAVPAGLTAVSGSGLAIAATSLGQEPIDVAKRTAFASLPGLAATRSAVTGFTGFEREVLVSSYSPAAGSCTGGTPCDLSCPTVSGQPTCRSVEVRVYYRGPLGDSTAALKHIFVK